MYSKGFYVKTFFFLCIIFLSDISVTNLYSRYLAGNGRGDRPTVAVVLSGGGSRGIAHIGVLQALEEQGVPIDFIAGTSMGAIIGGLYAAGYSPSEMLEIVLSDEFKDAASGNIDNKYTYYYKQTDPDPVWVKIDFSMEQFRKNGVRDIYRSNLPSSLVTPYLMDFLFMKYFEPAAVAVNYNFDNLFVPFRCVTSNIEDNRGEVMRIGSLADAIRASMTFPFYFQPITIDGRLMMDGGMYNNFPVDIVEMEFQPDIIIGSVVSGNPARPSSNDIITQLQNMLMGHTNYNINADKGFLIQPKVPKLQINDFSRSREIYTLGYDAANEQINDNSYIVDSRVDTNNVSERRKAFRDEIPDLFIDNVIVGGLNKDEKQFIVNQIKVSEKPMHIDDIKKNYLTVLSNINFNYSHPCLILNPETGYYDLFLDMQYDTYAQRRYGGNISSGNVSQAYTKLKYRWLRKNPVYVSSKLFLGKTYNSFSVSSRKDFSRKHPFYLNADLVYNNKTYSSRHAYIFEENKPSFLKQSEYLGNIHIGFPAGIRGKVEMGGFKVYNRNEFYDSRVFSKTDTANITSFEPYGLKVSYEYNTLDYNQYAQSGRFLNITMGYVNGSEKFVPGNTAVDNNRSINEHSWLEFSMRYEDNFCEIGRFYPGILVETFMSNRPLFSHHIASLAMAKQFNPFPIAKTGFLPEFRANNYLAAGTKLSYRLSDASSIQAKAFAFQPLEQIEVKNNYLPHFSENTNVALMANMAFVRHTFAGPLSLSVSYFENEAQPLMFMLNFGYILYNRNAFLF